MKHRVFYHEQLNLDQSPQHLEELGATSQKWQIHRSVTKAFEPVVNSAPTVMFQYRWTEKCSDSQLFINTLQRIHFHFLPHRRIFPNKATTFHRTHGVPWFKS